MDFEEPATTPIKAKENVVELLDWQQRAHGAERVLGEERAKYERAKQATRHLQAQLHRFGESDFQAKRHIQALSYSNIGLSQEVVRLRSAVDTLNGVLRIICDHSTCGNSCSGEDQPA